jgi:hypothetical protein
MNERNVEMPSSHGCGGSGELFRTLVSCQLAMSDRADDEMLLMNLAGSGWASVRHFDALHIRNSLLYCLLPIKVNEPQETEVDIVRKRV